ncbi:MAG TPA: hypothetical protein VH598_09260 [Verrucomicrobiae bacterium]|nr:hypothetical protein [Verrucomicrobiae bacterium]
MEFVTPGKARVAWRGELHLFSTVASSAATNKPLIGSWIKFDQDVDRVSAVLDGFKHALEHPAPDTGWIYQNNYRNVTNHPRFNFVQMRAVAQGLEREELQELHKGTLDAAIVDLHALAGLARLNRNEIQGMANPMVRVAIANLGLFASWEALQAPGWDEPRLASLQRDWEQVDLLDGLERGIQSTRAYGLIIMQELRRANGREFTELFGQFVSTPADNSLVRLWSEQILPLAYKLTSLNEDGLFMLTQMSREVEATRLIKSGRPWPEVSAISSNYWDQFEQKRAGDRFGRFLASRSWVPSWRALDVAVRAETLRRLTITAIALKRYQLRYNQPAPSLSALVPEFLGQVPFDPMSGKPLCYRLNPDGTFVLYSVGEDGKDDAGQGGNDLWTGPDAVWPRAVNDQ